MGTQSWYRVGVKGGKQQMKVWLVSLGLLPLLLAGCGQASSNGSAGSTVQYDAALVSQGRTLFSTTCYVCHGKNGQGNTGPALWGPNSAVQGFAQFSDLEQFIQANMPQNNPGSLSPKQALAAASFLWKQNHRPGS